jgi:hypothetical protein
MGAIRKNEQELLETFADYDDDFDSEITELSDIFAWDDDDFDDDFDDDEWFEELFGSLEDDDFDLSMEELFKINKTPGFELYKNENYDADKDEGLDLAFFSGFSAYSADNPEKPGNKRKPFPIDIDNITEASKIKIKHYPIVTQILDMVSQLLKDKKIFCKCGDFDGSISLLENCVRIECKKCASERDIKSSNISDVEYIAEMGELFLDFDD